MRNLNRREIFRTLGLGALVTVIGIPPIAIAAEPIVGSDIAIGTIFDWSGKILPAGWLECNGQSVTYQDYPKLYEVLTLSYGWKETDFIKFKKYPTCRVTLPDFRVYNIYDPSYVNKNLYMSHNDSKFPGDPGYMKIIKIIKAK